MFTCIYLHIYIYGYVHVCIYTYLHIYISVRTYLSVCMSWLSSNIEVHVNSQQIFAYRTRNSNSRTVTWDTDAGSRRHAPQKWHNTKKPNFWLPKRVSYCIEGCVNTRAHLRAHGSFVDYYGRLCFPLPRPFTALPCPLRRGLCDRFRCRLST